MWAAGLSSAASGVGGCRQPGAIVCVGGIVRRQRALPGVLSAGTERLPAVYSHTFPYPLILSHNPSRGKQAFALRQYIACVKAGITRRIALMNRAMVGTVFLRSKKKPESTFLQLIPAKVFVKNKLIVYGGFCLSNPMLRWGRRLYMLRTRHSWWAIRR